MEIADTFWKRYNTREDDATLKEALGQARTDRQLHADYLRLSHQVDKLMLIARALWEVMAEAHGLSDADLVERVHQIDLRDGKQDGKLEVAPKVCPKCGRKVSQRKHWCLYCGAKVPSDDVFENL